MLFGDGGVGSALLRASKIGVCAAPNPKQVSVTYSQNKSSFRNFVGDHQPKWESGKIRENGGQIQSPDGCPASCPPFYYRGSHFVYGENCFGVAHAPLGPDVPTESGHRNGKISVRGGITGQNKARIVWEFQSSALRSDTHQVVPKIRARCHNVHVKSSSLQALCGSPSNRTVSKPTKLGSNCYFKMCQLWGSSPSKLWVMPKNERCVTNYAHKGSIQVQASGSPNYKCMGTKKQTCYGATEQSTKSDHASWHEQFREIKHRKCPFDGHPGTTQQSYPIYARGIATTCELTTSKESQAIGYPAKVIRGLSEINHTKQTLSQSSRYGHPGESSTASCSENSCSGGSQLCHTTRIPTSATQSSGRSNYGTDHHCHINGQTGPGPHPKYDDQKPECKERQNKGLPGKTESEDHGESHRISRTNVITVSSCSSEPILVTGFHTPLHETNEDDSDSGSQENGDSNFSATNIQSSANSNLSNSSCSIQSRPNDVGDSHLPDQQEESGDSETTQSKITSHLRATHCVSTNSVVSTKTKVVPQEAKKNSVNRFNVVEDSFATNPNITHTLPHLRATHCVVSQVCDGTDTSDTEFQDHENTSSSDSSCSNQSWPNVVGDSHLPDQQEESDEDDSDLDPHGNDESLDTDPENPPLTKKSLTIVQWNTQSAKDKIGLLQAEIAEHDIDIVLLQDTRLKRRQDGIPKLRVDGYHTYHIPMSEDPAVQCHGLITLVNNRVPSKLITLPLNLGISTEVLSVKIWHEKKPIDIHNIYRVAPANIDLLPIFTNGHTSIIAGDFNAHHKSWCRTNNTSGQDLKSQLDDTNHFVLLNEPQVWTTTYETAIDLAICSRALAAFADWSSFPSLVSDHIAVKITIHKEFSYNGYNHNQGYLGKHADWEKYGNEITRQLQVTDTSGDMESCLTNLTDIIFKAADIAIPKKKAAPYIHKYWTKNPGVQMAKRLANQAIRAYRKRPSPEKKVAMKETFQQYQKVCTDVKHYSWYKWACECNNNTSSAAIWTRIRRCLGLPPREPTHPAPLAKANEIVDTFAARCSSNNLDQNTQDQLDRLRPIRITRINEAREQNAVTDRHITMDELNNVLSHKDTAPGADHMLYTMIANLPDKGKRYLLKVYNHSLREGIVPAEWKIAKIIPIPKKDHSFRPISLLPCISKVLDKIILNRLLYAADPVKNSALGFRKGVGTMDTITNLAHQLSKSRRNCVGAIFIDIEKAFEMVDQWVILDNLAKAGIKGKLLSWLQHYLTDRKGFVTFQGKQSELNPFEKGIPQGSSLSPTLFNYATNSLLETELPVSVQIHSYADDFVIYASHQHEHIVKERLQTALHLLTHKMTTLGLKLSTQKTEAMWFYKNTPQWRFRINNQPINWSASVKYLGVMLDKRLRMTAQSDYVKEKAERKLTSLKVLSGLSGVNSKVIKMAYTGVVRPVMEYGAPLVCMMSTAKQLNIQRVEHTALRLILRVPKWTYINSMYKECDLLPFRQRTEVSLAKLMVKTIADDRHPLHTTCAGVYNHMPCHFSKNSWIRKARIILHKLLPGDKVIAKELHQKVPPWEKCSFIRIVETSATKATTSPEELAGMAVDRIHDLYRHVHYYTDGSVNGDQSGAAFYSAGGHQAKRLSDGSSILQAELYAIKMALQHAVEFGGIPCINVDSRCAIAVLCKQSPLENQQLVFDIKALAERADGKPTLHWVPSHCGIEGNEIADNLAKTALDKPRADIILPISRQLAAKNIKSTALGIADAMLLQDQTWLSKPASKLSTTAAERRNILKITDRRTQRQIYKLRCFCYTKEYILLSVQSKCHLCDGNYKVAATHFLQECPAVIRRREILLEHIDNPQQNTMAVDILNSQSKRKNIELIKFINQIKLGT